jgi:hypothetical protein
LKPPSINHLPATGTQAVPIAGFFLRAATVAVRSDHEQTENLNDIRSSVDQLGGDLCARRTFLT